MKIPLIVQRLDSKCLKCTVTTYHFKLKFLTVLVSGKRYSPSRNCDAIVDCLLGLATPLYDSQCGDLFFLIPFQFGRGAASHF